MAPSRWDSTVTLSSQMALQDHELPCCPQQAIDPVGPWLALPEGSAWSASERRTRTLGPMAKTVQPTVRTSWMSWPVTG
jgi:hypothetical protein